MLYYCGMTTFDKELLFSYLQEEIKGLVNDGQILLSHAREHEGEITDFSYLVFPFSKAYEGFLKKFFLDLGLIREDEYYSDEIRIGRILNPGYLEEHKSIYKFLCRHEKGGEVFTNKLWEVWRKGRNQVFHYFPHNFRRLSYVEAKEIIDGILEVMCESVSRCYIESNNKHIKNTISTIM